MDKKIPDLQFTGNFIEIPDVFYSSDTGTPFSFCTMCGIELIENNVPYVIEKAIKNYQESKVADVIFEYAMCINCMDKMKESLSSVSLQNINNYILTRTNLPLRRNKLIKEKKFDVKDWISNCIVYNKAQNDLPEYQIMCQCQGGYMLYTYMPYMLSCDATEEMQQLLSKKTKDELDKFYNDNLGMPPELKELFRTRVPVI